MEKNLRAAAHKNLLQYRRMKAYIDGFAAADNPNAPDCNAVIMRSWVVAIDAVMARLRGTRPALYTFADRYFGISAPRYGHSSRAILISLCDELYVSLTTLYAWRNAVLDLVILAATQTGVLLPYSISSTDTPSAEAIA